MRVRALASSAIALAILVGGRAFAQLSGAPRFRLHTIDVGQGSATLVEAKCGVVLVDTGSGEGRADAFEEYLGEFFALRPDLNRTLEAVYITHSHIDHTRGLMSVVRNFKVKRVVTNGRYGSSGGAHFNALFSFIRTAQTPPLVVEVLDSEVLLSGQQGLTSRDIDPLKCADCDPDIRIHFGSLEENPGWTQSAFGNANNHSLVIRVKLGSSAWLVTGDLEEAGIARLLERYTNSEALRATILTVGHHGSRNGTTVELLDTVKPRYALISCGQWNEGRGSNNPFTTFRYGHPNKGVLEMLQKAISTKRDPITVKAGTGSQSFVNYTIKKGVYCTAWDGSLVTDAYASGRTSTRQSGIGR